MFTNAKKILITTERREVFIVRRPEECPVVAFCSACGESVTFLSFDLAITESNIGGHELMLRSQRGEVHSIETDTGHLLICRRSIAP